MEEDVDDGDDRVEVRPGDGREDEDEDCQAEGRRKGVLQQLQAGVAGREALRGDSGADDDDGESGAAEELAGQGARGGVHARGPFGHA